jgi:hypothetical protein
LNSSVVCLLEYMSLLVADFVAKVGCCRWAVGHFVKSSRL